MNNILDNLATEVDKIEETEEKVVKTATDDTAPVELSEMDSLLESEGKFPEVGDVVKGTVIETASNAIYLDLHPFGTGVVMGREIKDGMGGQKIKVGDEVTATVTDLENEDGFIELSIREASYEKAWDDIESKRDTREKVATRVVGVNKGGLLMEVNGINGFLPVSQLSSKNYPRVEDGDKNKILALLKKLQGQELEVRILDADRETEKLILSEKAAQSEKDREIVAKISVGSVVEGEISGVVDFGAFVKFLPEGVEDREENKLEGLVHISELAWQLIENPRTIVKTGDRVKAQVIGLDDEKISLSIRALQEDPWSAVAKKYKVGDIVSGTVHKINPFGAFVYLDKDIHGLAHISEMSESYPGKNIHELIKNSETYDWKILSIEPKEHRMGLLLMTKDKKEKEKEEKKSAKKEKTEKTKKVEEKEEKPKKAKKEKVEKAEKKPAKKKEAKADKEEKE